MGGCSTAGCLWHRTHRLRLLLGAERWPSAPGQPRVPRPPPSPPASLSQLAEEEEFEAKRKELEEQASPVFAKLYQQGGAGGMPGGGMPGGDMPGGGAPTGPTVEEVD